MTTSPSCGVMDSQISAFHVPAVKSESLLQPARMPRFRFGLSDASAAKEIGEWNTTLPLARAASHTATVLASMPFSAMTADTAG